MTNKSTLLIILAAITTLAALPTVTANTWNLTDSVTGTQGTLTGTPTYQSNGYFYYNGSQFFDTGIAVNYTGSYSITAWARVNQSVPCQDGGNIIGRWYSQRIFTGASCEAIANIWNTTGSDTTHYNASLLFGNNTWTHVAWTYDAATNTSYFYRNGILQSTLTQRGTYQSSFSNKWRVGGDDSTNLWTRSAITNVTIHNKTLSLSDVTYLYGNNTPYCTDLKNWWAFAPNNLSCLSSTPVTATYTNITINTTTSIRQVPYDYLTAWTGNRNGYPDYTGDGGPLRNFTLNNETYTSLNIVGTRLDMDLGNICTTYSGNITAPCVWNTNNLSAYANINLHKTTYANVLSRGGHLIVTNDGPPAWLASNQSQCMPGGIPGAPDFNYSSCPPSNFTMDAMARIQYFRELGCDDNPGTCSWEGRNEIYLTKTGTDTGTYEGVFYMRGAVNCAYRITNAQEEWNQTTPIIKAALNTTIGYISLSGNYGYHQCGVMLLESQVGNYTAGSLANVTPDYLNSHEYNSGTDPLVLITRMQATQDIMTAGGWGTQWVNTEVGLNNDALNKKSPEVSAAAFQTMTIYTLNNMTVQRLTHYAFGDDSEGRDMQMFNNTALTTVGSILWGGLAQNASKYIGNTTLYPCAAKTSNLTCAYGRKNSTHGVILFSNYGNTTLIIENINITGVNISSASSNTNTSTATVYNNRIVNLTLTPYRIESYNVTFNAATNDTTAPTIVTRTDYSNQSLLQVNITCNEACNASINYGTVSSTLGNVSSITSYSLTTQSFNRTPVLSNTLYYYNITVCDISSNCATYGTYSEQTSNYSISYNTTAPSQNITINEPDSQGFSILINNPSAVTVTYEWLINGSNQTTAYNSTGVTFTGSYTSAGVYNITNKVYTSNNNQLNYSWQLTVNDVNATIASSSQLACQQAQEGINGLATYLRLIAIAVGGAAIAFGVWKFSTGDFTFDTAQIVGLTLALVVSGIMMVIGSVIVSGAVNTCV